MRRPGKKEGRQQRPAERRARKKPTPIKIAIAPGDPIDDSVNIAYWSGGEVVNLTFHGLVDAKAQSGFAGIMKGQLLRDDRKFAWVLVYVPGQAETYSDLCIRANASLNALNAAQGVIGDMRIAPYLSVSGECGDDLSTELDELTIKQLMARLSGAGMCALRTSDEDHVRISVASPEAADTYFVCNSPGGDA